MLCGFTPPYSATGRSALVPAPPWHYAGEVLSLAFSVAPEMAQTFLPEGFGRATGTAYGHFCEWQATTDGSELLDPVYAQYKEFFVLVEAEPLQGGARALFSPLIWVDQDISMIRGLLQGWPKKLGQIWMTRSYDLDHPAAARREAGARVGVSLAVKDRRLAESVTTLNGEEGRRLGFIGLPTFGLVGAPSIIGSPSRGEPRLVRATVSAKVMGRLFAGTAELRFLDSPRDELSLLAPLGPAEASLCAFALTVTGAAEGRPW